SCRAAATPAYPAPSTIHSAFISPLSAARGVRTGNILLQPLVLSAAGRMRIAGISETLTKLSSKKKAGIDPAFFRHAVCLVDLAGRAIDNSLREFDAHLLGSAEIDDEIGALCYINSDIARLFPLEDLHHDGAGLLADI